MSIKREEVLQRLRAAYDRFLDKDFELLELDANERSLTHKLAEHLQIEFPDWSVDCEYNRSSGFPKRLQGFTETVSTSDTDGRTVFPDIIVHHRGTSDNLVVIEAKKSTTVSLKSDEEKLKAYKSEHGYRYAFAVVFRVREQASNARDSTDIMEISFDVPS